MTWLMRGLPAGSFGWLVLHELRLNLRGVRRRALSTWLGLLLLFGYVAIGISIALGLRDVAMTPSPIIFDGLLAVSLLALSLMATQAVLASYRTLYDAGDLDLLLSSPAGERTVLQAKLIGIAATIVLTYAVLTLPIVVPLAAIGHPQFWGVIPLLVALALTAACIGLGITLLIAGIAGPRAARTVGQITAALLGGGFFIVSQLLSRDRPGRGRIEIFERLRDSRIGESPLGSVPGRAAFGEPIAIILLLGATLILFTVASRIFQSRFLASYQAAGMRLARTKASRRGIRRHFKSGLFATIFAKEFRLLLRDPALAFQIVLRLVYLAPLMFLGLGGRGGSNVPFAASLAFASVLVVGQLVGSFAWLTISAEDSPDLLTVAPIDKAEVNRAKLIAALFMAAPIGIVLPIAVTLQSPIGGIVTLVMTVIAGVLAGVIELSFGKPMPRKSFNRRRGSGVIAGILGIVVTIICGGIAGVSVYFLGQA
ncbi:MAG: hypothetical protein B7Y43_04415 [Sphingomonas sp. 28-62-20]|uniref:hypothetical protein n=1 Tax=Sphingomonas sp. 28-62-20 TaxID=1970433 RepID=UPI000BCC0E66|nr:MAG: hypothetical protein B7Y43_04415 [Sphingomonas sp. 28-62-20]